MEMKVSISPCFHPAVMFHLKAKVHHSPLPGITQILPHTNQNKGKKAGKKDYFMTDPFSSRNEDVDGAHNQIEKLNFCNIP